MFASSLDERFGNLNMLATVATNELAKIKQQLCQALQQKLKAIQALQQREWTFSPLPNTQYGLMIKAHQLSVQIILMNSELIMQVTQKSGQQTSSIADILDKNCKELQTALQQQRNSMRDNRWQTLNAIALPAELQASQQQQLRWLEELQIILSPNADLAELLKQLQAQQQSLWNLNKVLTELFSVAPQLPQVPPLPLPVQPLFNQQQLQHKPFQFKPQTHCPCCNVSLQSNKHPPGSPDCPLK